MNGSTVVGSLTPPVLPQAATAPPYRSPRIAPASTSPPTQSTAPAQRVFSSGRAASPAASSREITSDGAQRRAGTSASLPVEATTS